MTYAGFTIRQNSSSERFLFLTWENETCVHGKMNSGEKNRRTRDKHDNKQRTKRKIHFCRKNSNAQFRLRITFFTSWRGLSTPFQKGSLSLQSAKQLVNIASRDTRFWLKKHELFRNQKTGLPKKKRFPQNMRREPCKSHTWSVP